MSEAYEQGSEPQVTPLASPTGVRHSDLDIARSTPAGLARVATNGRWQMARHLELLNRKLLMVAGGHTPRLAVHTPPRHGKSELISRFFPPWFLGVFPDRKVILSTHEAEFAKSWGRKAREVCTEWGPSLFGVGVSEKSQAADWWEIEGHDGAMYTAGVGGPITGKGAHCLIIDDPIKNQDDAQSQFQRDRVWDWWGTTAVSRMEPGGVVVVVMTRWHEDDLVGRLIQEEGLAKEGGLWEYLRLPCYAEAPDPDRGIERDPLGRLEGEVLWPERWPREELEKKTKGLTATWFNAMYQGRPAPAEGNVFKKEHFRHWRKGIDGGFVLDGRVVERKDLRSRYFIVDLAASTKTRADYTVIGEFGTTASGDLILVDLRRARLDGPEQVREIKQRFFTSRPDFVGIESASYQLTLVQTLREASIPVRELRADRDKHSRAMSTATRMEGHNVWFPYDVGWRKALEDELLTFPYAAHDDQVDVLGYAVQAQQTSQGLRIRVVG